MRKALASIGRSASSPNIQRRQQDAELAKLQSTLAKDLKSLKKFGLSSQEIKNQTGVDVGRCASGTSGSEPLSADSGRLTVVLSSSGAEEEEEEEEEEPLPPTVSNFIRESYGHGQRPDAPIAVTVTEVLSASRVFDPTHKHEIERAKSISRNQVYTAIDRQLTQGGPTYEEQMAVTLLMCEPNVCMRGWKCFDSQLACRKPPAPLPTTRVVSPRPPAGESPRFSSFIERRAVVVQHECFIEPRSPSDQRMWSVACAFFEKTSVGPERYCTIILRAQAEIWAQRRELLQRNQTLPLGIFILAAIYVGAVKLDEIKQVDEVATPDIYIHLSADCEFKREL